MKFGRKFEQSKIPEWADFYVSYKLLKKLLSPFNALKKGILLYGSQKAYIPFCSVSSFNDK